MAPDGDLAITVPPREICASGTSAGRRSSHPRPWIPVHGDARSAGAGVLTKAPASAGSKSASSILGMPRARAPAHRSPSSISEFSFRRIPFSLS
eukprot:scaffold3218_cov99-Isochrysis_galbana.AAC.4